MSRCPAVLSNTIGKHDGTALGGFATAGHFYDEFWPPDNSVYECDSSGAATGLAPQKAHSVRIASLSASSSSSAPSTECIRVYTNQSC